MPDFQFHNGDTRALRVRLLRATGRPIKLGAPGPDQSSVQFQMVGAVPGLPTLDKPAVVLEGTQIPEGDPLYSPSNPTKLFAPGTVEYRWEPGDPNEVPGLYRTSFKITTVAGDTETVPNRAFFDLRVE
jgi:hypothetical protein